MKQLGVLLPPPLDRMLNHHRVMPSSKSPVPIQGGAQGVFWISNDGEV